MASSARIDELRKKFDENPRRYFAPLANEYRKAGDLEQAIFICQEYLPQQPGHMSGHIVYGQALFELSRHEESRLVFETALSLDPENLIALRHLGDIARHTGDNKSARIWYQRVLEADPRNEEIAQVMMTLLATPDISQPVVASDTAAPLSAPAVPAVHPIDFARPTDPVGIRAVDTGFQVEKSSDGSDLAVGPALTELPERQGTPVAAAPPVPEWTSPVREDDLLDISDFSVGGVLLSEIGTEPSVDEPPTPVEAQEAIAEEQFTESSSAFVADPSLGYERSGDDASVPYPGSVDDDYLEKEEPALEADLPFEADPFAIAAAPQLEDHAEDIALGPPDDGTPQTTFGGASDESVLGLETFEHGVSAPATESSTLEFESFFSPPTEAPSTVDPIVVEQSVEADTQFESATPAESLAAEAWPVFEGGASDDDDSMDVVEIVDVVEVVDVVEIMESVAETPTESLLAFESSVSAWSEPEREPEPESEPEPEPVPEPELESVFETPIAPFAAVPEPEPAYSAATPVFSTPAEPSEAPAFVTETMAELYLQQGHLEPALEIYQQLVAQRPDDLALVDRMRVIEDTLHGRSTRQEQGEAEWQPEAVPATRGPTIRDFLASLVATPTPLSTPAVGDLDEPVGAFDDAGDTWGETPMTADAAMDALDLPDMIDAPPSIDEDFGAPETIVPEPAFDPYATPISSASLTPPPSTRSVTPLMNSAVTPPSSSAVTPIVNPAVQATPADARRTLTRGLTPAIARETVSGSIDALFSGADASSKDSSAASTLAQAFAPEGPETTPLQGMPAHKASSELSLDHVFKTGQAPRAEGESDGFSFDQFFSDDLGDTAAKSPNETPASPKQAPDDIAQFNAWLNGLKKT